MTDRASRAPKEETLGEALKVRRKEQPEHCDRMHFSRRTGRREARAGRGSSRSDCYGRPSHVRFACDTSFRHLVLLFFFPTPSLLMWMRTTMNYQYAKGSSTTQAFKTLYREGGVFRFYRGYWAALAQGPLSRFGDTAANTGMLVLLNRLEPTKNLDVGTKTLAASLAAGLFRMVLMPIDAVKTSMQVGGSFKPLAHKIRISGIGVLWHGAFASAAATVIGHWPWFATYNLLSARLPEGRNHVEKLARSAFIGFSASVVSDTLSNSVRVIKTVRQTYDTPISYVKAAQVVVEKDGVMGLFGRGLKTRLITNGMQGLMFSVLWRLIDERLNGVQSK